MVRSYMINLFLTDLAVCLFNVLVILSQLWDI